MSVRPDKIRSIGPPSIVPLALAAGPPLLCFLASASAHDYWLDGGEFTAAAAELGISHPPGHPLAALVGAGLSLIPLGPLALRVALMNALCCALCAAFVYRTVDSALFGVGLVRGVARAALACAATWLFAFAPGVWFQAVRPEVYALEGALVLLALERTVVFEARFPRMELQPLYVAATAIGFALANHHFLGLLILPALAPSLARVQRELGVSAVMRVSLFAVPGLLTYLYLPLRAAQGPPLNLGDPDTPGRFLWVVSAAAFQKNTGAGVDEPAIDRVMDVAVQLASNLGVGLAFALCGMYLLLRRPVTRRLGFLLSATIVVYAVARAWLGFVRGNPDASGYLLPAFAAGATLAATFVGIVFRTVAAARHRQPGWGAAFVALVLAAGSAFVGFTNRAEGSLASFAATDAFDDTLRRDLPPNAVVIATAPQTIFRWYGGEASELSRPDLTLVPVPFLPYPGMIDAIVERAPELRPVLRGYLLEGAFRPSDLESLATERPVLIEIDPHTTAQDLLETIVPHGHYHQVIPDPAYRDDRVAGAEQQAAVWNALERVLGAEQHEPETMRHLLFRHYMNALYFAATGLREEALASTRRALTLGAEARELRALEAALAGDPEARTPLDIQPYLP